MKVLLLNGSRKEKGCTYTALSLAAEALAAEGIDTEILQAGKGAVDGEIGRIVQEIGEKMKDADGLIIGSPVYYASPSGEILSVLDRVFWKYADVLRYKPCATVVSARRAGTTASLDVLNKYPTICEMPLVSSRYWNMVHGFTPEDVMKDEEGCQIMKVLGRNMAWMLKCIDAGARAGIERPAAVRHVMTNFIR